jgi:hypothetical protein
VALMEVDSAALALWTSHSYTAVQDLDAWLSN